MIACTPADTFWVCSDHDSQWRSWFSCQTLSLRLLRSLTRANSPCGRVCVSGCGFGAMPHPPTCSYCEKVIKKKARKPPNVDGLLTKKMNTFLSRLNGLFAFTLTVLACVTFACYLSILARDRSLDSAFATVSNKVQV